VLYGGHEYVSNSSAECIPLVVNKYNRWVNEFSYFGGENGSSENKENPYFKQNQQDT